MYNCWEKMLQLLMFTGKFRPSVCSVQTEGTVGRAVGCKGSKEIGSLTVVVGITGNEVRV
jgi:hypothetical protein